MSDTTVQLLDQATSRLKLRNITLFASNFLRPALIPPEQTEINVALFEKRAVNFAKIDLTEEGKTTTILKVFVDLGLRMVAADAPSGSDAPVYVQIEATFLAEYGVLGDISDEAIKVFAERNSVHNVWPFWRQHVYDIVQRGSLPHLDIPLFSGNRLDQPEATRD